MNNALSYLSMLFKRHSPSKEWLDIEKFKTQAYMEGYKQGRKDERMELIFITITPNVIIEACGLESIEKGEINNGNENRELVRL